MLSDLWNRLIAWTGTLVAPDWAALVALIPVLLLLVVVAFLAITAAKWSAAGPTRRGPGRRPPLAADGRPVQVASAAPIAVACGAFVLAFGLVAGGAWLPVGIVATALGLVWWVAALRGGRSPGTEAPGSSSRTAGARDPGPEVRRARVTPGRVAVAGVALVAAGVLIGTSKVVPDPPVAGGASSALASAQASTPGPGQRSLPSADVTLAAQDIAFVERTLTAPAGRPFRVAFDNRDNVPHNLEIRDATGKVLFMGDIVTGPIVTVYDVPALPAGQYPFVCTVHPAMTGTLTVK